MRDDEHSWEPMKLTGLRRRLVEVQTLLQQAAAVGLAQDVAKLQTLAEHEEADGARPPRRLR